MAQLETGSRSGVTPGQPLEEVPTPSLVVDLDIVERNIATWQEVANRNGKKFRPHIKTHKIPEIALMQEAAGAVGIAGAKPSELEVFVDAGCRNVVLAYPTVGSDKWSRLARMAHSATVTVNVDSENEARGLSAAAAHEDVTLKTQIEIDSGLNRCGFALEDYDQIAAFARLLESLPGIQLDGITTHRGKFSERLAQMTNEEAGHEEGQILVDLAEKLRADGIAITEITAGGTITGRGVAEVPGITEVRAGTCIFNDAMQVEFGAAAPEDVAVFVLATVVSTRRAGWATIDAGSKTFSGDKAVVGANVGRSSAVAPGLGIDANVMRITEEHGMVELGEGVRVETGQKLRFTPFHACTAVNLSDELVGVRNGVVEKVWPVLARGKRV
jgi:D-serine deaminase-like pyridoxal phosphate-dependent protein